ncbi:hypothetical protein GXP67_26295 [Rhodocytophaga rosea]|uniref:Lipoprotein n=1 Tax=Rhodocytophaga rosea TaxID=2704465 RepID=A0A6C0GPY0_9BACT|nr:hypothetical protein [Rhodocytophaga rosea]QHT69904.1 hypothetical protein GXP67_26295 [Rhodocytophaga rosea]
MLRRYILYAAGFVILTISSFSCELITGPNFPDAPKISFRDIRKFRVTDRLGNTNDSISIALKFQDGDGDLGLTQEEIDNHPPPYQQLIQNPDGSTSPNPRYYNYYIQQYRKVNEDWVPEDRLPSLKGHFPVLNEGKKGPIEGTLYYAVSFPLTPSSAANAIYKYDIYILDRAGNASNTITTSEVIINEK